jgi:hypothetical protein
MDASGMFAICSEMCNADLHSGAEKMKGTFKQKVLRDMLTQELESRAIDIILPATQDAILVACPLAVQTFKEIVALHAGAQETERADALLQRLVVGDEGVCSERVANLKLSGKIKAPARSIFGFGDAMGMPTLTANVGFVRAAASQGVKLSVIPLHCGGRALSELAERDPGVEY